MRALLPFFLFFVSLGTQAATYRWVDENGKVHYGDVLPSQTPSKGGAELDKQGRVKKDSPGSLISPAERRRMEEARVREEEARRQAEAQRRRDQALLTTFVSEDEIDLARDRALEQEVARLRGLSARLTAASEKLTYANGQISHYMGNGMVPPRTFTQMKTEAEGELAAVNAQILNSQNSMQDIKLRAEADRLRFRELKGYR